MSRQERVEQALRDLLLAVHAEATAKQIFNAAVGTPVASSAVSHMIEATQNVRAHLNALRAEMVVAK